MSRFLNQRLRAFEAYVPGEQPSGGYIKLNTNEAPFPPPPGVFERLTPAEIRRLNLYPDPDGKALTAKLAGLFGMGPGNVMLSNGSDEMLSFAFTAFCGSGVGAVFPDVTYGFYRVLAGLYGISYEEMPLRDDFTVDVSDYLGVGATVVLANPNAPTGLALPVRSIEAILAANPRNVVVVDEAYVDFGAESCAGLVGRYDNLLVVRTYSKSRFMAGARLGFALGSEGLIKDLKKIKYSVNPYNINRLTLAAGEAAADDNAYYEENWRRLEAGRRSASERLERMGFAMTDSKANFLFARHPNIAGRELYAKLREAGILVRRFDQPRIGDYLRISVGSGEQMDALCLALSKILERSPEK